MRSGLALVDKPLGISSHAVVALARKALDTKKVGHAGTLDPDATGLLVLGIGVGTRLLTFCVGMDKTYQAVMRLGYGTTTDDAQGERIEGGGKSLDTCTPAAIDQAVQLFRGDIQQIPSSFSAIKVDGRRSYQRARAGEEVSLAARGVRISVLERGEIRSGQGLLDIELSVECSSGTYIRALARDIGDQLGVGGHLVALRRTAVGPFSVADAMSSAEITQEGIIDLAASASLIMPTVTLSRPARDDISHGRAVPCADWPQGQPVAAVDATSGDLVAVVECRGGFSRILMGVPNS